MQIWSKRVSARVGAKAKEGKWGGGCFREKNIRSPEENTCTAGYSSTQSIWSSFFSSCCTVSSAGG